MLKVALLTLTIGWDSSTSASRPPVPTQSKMIFEGPSAAERCVAEEERIHVLTPSVEGDWKTSAISIGKYGILLTKTLCVKLSE